MRHIRLTPPAVLLATAALLTGTLSGCGPSSSQGRGVGSGTGTSGQTLDWHACPPPTALRGGGEAPEPLPDGTRWECTTMQVPADWDKPSGKVIGIELIRARSSGRPQQRIGSLFFNFGGPGGSGVATLPGFAPAVEKLRTRYDLVSFDPRGVGGSEGVRCLGTPSEDRPDSSPDDGKEIATLLDFRRRQAAACESNSGGILPYVRTTQTARDMDLMRQLLGDDTLHYFGMSYGSELGGVYAHLFPRHVGRTVLDGVVDPTQNQRTRALGQAAGFQRAFEHFATWCAGEGCAAGSDARDIVRRVVDLEARLDDHPMAARDGKELTGQALVAAITGALYRHEYWPVLRVALEATFKGNPTVMLDVAQKLGQSPEARSGDPSDDAYQAIMCADRSDRYTLADVKTDLPEFRRASPLFGPTMAWDSLLLCLDWPVPGTVEHPRVDAPGASPILLVGNTGDPATPYEGTAVMAKALGTGVGVPLTFHGEGHVAYATGNACVVSTVNTYLLDGRLPAPGSVCIGDPLPEGK